MLTGPFEPYGHEFVALYLFDSDGGFLEAKIDDLGLRPNIDAARGEKMAAGWLAELGPVTFCRIEVAPFEVERFGLKFGLIPRPPEDDEDDWWVELQPGNYMAFHEPWDSGDYDT